MTALSIEAFEGLARNRIFEGIQRDLLEKIAPEVRVMNVEPGEVIFREGDRGDLLYIVGEGSVKISKIGRGGDQETLGYIQPGNFFGEMALLDGQLRSAMATAAERSRLTSCSLW
jgi:CRP/FNR family transcriptional regulator, cyclic AMP receptor protein